MRDLKAPTLASKRTTGFGLMCGLAIESLVMEIESISSLIVQGGHASATDFDRV